MGDWGELARRATQIRLRNWDTCEESSWREVLQLEWDIAERLGEIPEHEVREIGCSYEWYRRAGETRLTRCMDSECRRIEGWAPDARARSLETLLRQLPEGWRLEQLGESECGSWHAALLLDNDAEEVVSADSEARRCSSPSAALLSAWCNMQRWIEESGT